MGYLSEIMYIEKLHKVFKNVPIKEIEYAVRKFRNESEQNEYLRQLNKA